MARYEQSRPRSSADDRGYNDQRQRDEDERAKAQQNDFARASRGALDFRGPLHFAAQPRRWQSEANVRMT